MANDLLQFQSSSQANIVELHLPISLDATEFDELHERILALLKSNPAKKWILDLAGTTYMASAMLGMLVNMRQQIKASGGHLVLCNLSKPLIGIFKTCCMERLFTIVKDRAAALAE